MTEVKVQLESWDSIWPEAAPLMKAHFEEVRAKPLLPFEVDSVYAEEMWDQDYMLVVAARANQELVGYSIWWVTPNLEAKGAVQGVQGPWYVKPKFRGIGRRMFDLSVKCLKDLGAVTLRLHHSTNSGDIVAGSDVGGFYKSMGAEPIEIIYEMKV